MALPSSQCQRLDTVRLSHEDLQSGLGSALLWSGFIGFSLISKTGLRSSWEVSLLTPPGGSTRYKLGLVVRPDSAASPPLLLFLRKILFHLSSWMDSATESGCHTVVGPGSQGPHDSALPSYLVWGKMLQEGRGLSLKYFDKCFHQGH